MGAVTLGTLTAIMYRCCRYCCSHRNTSSEDPVCQPQNEVSITIEELKYRDTFNSESMINMCLSHYLDLVTKTYMHPGLSVTSSMAMSPWCPSATVAST